MVKVALKPSFLKDSYTVFRQRGLKKLLLGQSAELAKNERLIVRAAKQAAQQRPATVRQGSLQKVDVIHKGSGKVILAPHPDNDRAAVVVLYDSVRITNGPDLWLYLITSRNPRKDFGQHLDLGMLHGNKGDQVYEIQQPIDKLTQYQAVVVYCKQFDVLFSYALLP